MNFSANGGDGPPTTDDDDPNKWERMYHASLNAQLTKTSAANANGAWDEPDDRPATAMASPTASDIRVVTFDLDNTVWKTGATISDANDALAEHLMEEFGIDDRSEKRMGKLFKEFPDRYAGVDHADAGATDTAAESAEEGDLASLVENVGQSEIDIPTAQDDGVHIQASFDKTEGGKAKKKPVYLTLLRKDAIRSLLHESGVDATIPPLEVEERVDHAFEVWIDARCRSISHNFAPGAVSTLTTLRSQLQSNEASRKVYIGAITDGNSNPDRVDELAGVFDFVIRAEDVGVSKPDPRVYKAAVAALMMHIERDGGSVEEFFLGEEVEAGIATGTYIHSDSTLGEPSWKDVDPEAVEAFAEAVGPWWVHIGDDFFKDVVAAKEMGMRTVWSRELIANEDKGKGATDKRETDEKQRSVTDLVNDVAKSDGVLTMAIGESEFLSNSLHEEFSDAILDRFDSLGSLLAEWHEEGKRSQGIGSSPANGAVDASYTIINPEMNELSSSTTVDSAGVRKEQSTEEIILEESPSRKFCVFCGGSLPMAAKFCSHCGEKQI